MQEQEIKRTGGQTDAVRFMVWIRPRKSRTNTEAARASCEILMLLISYSELQAHVCYADYSLLYHGDFCTHSHASTATIVASCLHMQKHVNLPVSVVSYFLPHDCCSSYHHLQSLVHPACQPCAWLVAAGNRHYLSFCHWRGGPLALQHLHTMTKLDMRTWSTAQHGIPPNKLGLQDCQTDEMQHKCLCQSCGHCYYCVALYMYCDSHSTAGWLSTTRSQQTQCAMTDDAQHSQAQECIGLRICLALVAMPDVLHFADFSTTQPSCMMCDASCAVQCLTTGCWKQRPSKIFLVLMVAEVLSLHITPILPDTGLMTVVPRGVTPCDSHVVIGCLRCLDWANVTMNQQALAGKRGMNKRSQHCLE